MLIHIAHRARLPSKLANHATISSCRPGLFSSRMSNNQFPVFVPRDVAFGTEFYAPSPFVLFSSP
jgi:hypothetical protein